jgi:hypothetical protein
MRPGDELYPRGHEFNQNGVDGPAICKKCHAVHQHKHWIYDDELAATLREQPQIASVVCPGCHAVQIKKADGYLTLSSPLVRSRREEIENLIYAEEKRQLQKNPLGRIIFVDVHGDSMEIATTTTFLAKDLGRQIEKALGGELIIDKLPREPFMRVRWTRPMEE